MGTGTKVLIGFLGLAVIGVSAFFIVKYVKKSGSSIGSVSGVTNSSLSDYLKSKLTATQLSDLKGWLELITNERAKDSTRWTKSNEYASLEISDVAHALYQMKVWNEDIRKGLKNLK